MSSQCSSMVFISFQFSLFDDRLFFSIVLRYCPLKSLYFRIVSYTPSLIRLSYFIVMFAAPFFSLQSSYISSLQPVLHTLPKFSVFFISIHVSQPQIIIWSYQYFVHPYFPVLIYTGVMYLFCFRHQKRNIDVL